MSTRRQFIRHSSLLTAGLVISREEWFKKKQSIGVQLYTLRNDMAKDPKGSLQKVASLGYKQVETYGYNKGKWFGLTAQELKDVLKTNGLTSPSGHTFPGDFLLKEGWEENWKQAVGDSAALGQEYIGIPWLGNDNRNAEGFKRLGEALNKAGEISKASNVKLAYHNHDFEFANVDGQTGLDIMMKATDPSLVAFELDLYWASKAGFDPIKLFEQYPHRFSMWHVKDMDNTDKKFFTEVGNGVIDFKAIFKKAGQSGMKYFFVEQDQCPGSPFDSIQKSIDYLKKNIVK